MTKSIDRAAVLRRAWFLARHAAVLTGEPLRSRIGPAMRAAWALAKTAAVATVPQPAQQQQGKAAPASSDALHARIRELAAVERPRMIEIASLFAQLPGVVSCHPELEDGLCSRLVIKATGTRCGDLDRPYALPFLMEAFGIPAIPRENEMLDLAIERNERAKARRAAEIERDGFDRAVDRTIVKGAYRAEVSHAEYGQVVVLVFADLVNRKTTCLGRVVMDPQPTRGEVLYGALAELGYYRTLDMDADDGSEIPTPKLAALESRLARSR
ncbi:hypothetical protein [Methylorubrum sp. DB1722]|uniref:hypothetical protein n=1 Tax=Methylorubrum sp. DB1722 TaxID=2478916 RepID=UPI0018E3659B|nr:hypothetical protein [Methylorubrum sp. DB1722]MBI1689550.1 hypothetical protein [Methylorubrum sp. DB1722]